MVVNCPEACPGLVHLNLATLQMLTGSLVQTVLVLKKALPHTYKQIKDATCSC